MPAALQNGINGTTNLLLQLPDGVRNLVVADGGDAPRTLSPLTQGATEAVAALNAARAGGTRHTGAALDAAVAGLPPEAGRSRLVLLYTGAPDAGGEPAEQLGRRLAQAGVVLAVVTTGPGQRYWSEAAGVTGGVVVPATGTASLRPFDRAASALRGRFVLTFPRPSTLPATVRVSMTVAGQTVVAVRDGAGGVGGDRAAAGRNGPGRRRGGGCSARSCCSRSSPARCCWPAGAGAPAGRRLPSRAGGEPSGAGAGPGR